MPYEVTIRVPDDADHEAAGSTRTIEVDEDEPILRAARAQDLWLPADCQQGWCTTCAARLLEGEVDMTRAIRYYEADREADLILLCVARPRSDVTVEALQQRAMLEHRAAEGLPPGSAKLDP